jgi:alpha-1,3-rhamnosyl/mannosyltransferase
LGFVEDLPALYNGAALLVYPSRFEGFGLPPLEAMACGIPVVVSDATSLPEVVGDAGLIVPLDDVQGLAAAIAQVLEDRSDWERLSNAGLARAKSFTWRHHAERLFEAYRCCLPRNGVRPQPFPPTVRHDRTRAGSQA